MTAEKEGEIMKKYIKWGIVFLGILASVVSFTAVKNIIISKEVSEKLQNQDPIVFSAFFRGENRDEGTYFYDLNQESLQKISDEIFSEIFYNQDKTRFVGKVENDAENIEHAADSSFVGFAEYDVEKKEFRPLISLEELRDLFKNPQLEIYDIYRLQYYQRNYSIYYDGAVYGLSLTKEGWKIREIAKGSEQFQWGAYYIWDGSEENIYVRAKTKDGEWKLIKYCVKTGKSEVLLNDVSEFTVSPDENTILYSAYSKGRIYLYDVQSQESVLLAKYREFFLGDSFKFSSEGNLAFYIEQRNGAFDRIDMYRFYVVDTETNEVRLIKDWKREASFQGVSW